MAIVFPQNSAIGATYDYGGIHYIYNGDGWVNKSIYGVSAGTNISFSNYNGTGPLIISATDTTGITSAVTSIRGLSGAVGLTAGEDIFISIVGNTLAISSPTVYGISGNIYASNLATGLLYGGIISINAGNTAKFDITAGLGQIHASGSSYTAPPQPTFQYVTWPGQTGITVTNLATSDTTWLYIDSSGNVQQRTEYYTDEQLETEIIIGQLVHPSRTFINLARTNPNVAYATDKQYEQFIRAFGPIKVSGHTISPNGANLKLNRSSGKAFSLGRNWINDSDNPSVVSDNAQTDCIFFRYYRGVTAGSFVTVPNQTAIDPTKYDDGTGVLATAPGGKYTIQRLFYYPNTPTLLGVYYGRALYTSIADAAANINLEDFTEIENTRTNAIFAGYLIVKGGATDLSNSSDALILQSGSFRSTSSGGGSVSLTLDDLTDVIITSPQNYQVLTYVDGVTGWENLSVTALPLVSSFNGHTGAVQGVSAAVAGSGISVSGATGSVTITNTGVLSFNGKTGAIQGVSSINGSTGAITNVAFTNVAQTFTAAQSFSAGISGSGATFGGSIVLQNDEFIRNSTNGRVDIMPAPSGSTHYGIYFDNTSWGFGTILGTIRSSDGAINTGGNFRFDVPLTILNDTRFQFGNDGHYGVYRSTTGNDTGQLYALSNNASNSGAIALVNYFAVGNANRSPGTTHVHPNFYIYANGTTSANDFMRLEHDSTRGIIETGGTSGLTLKPGSGVVAIQNKAILGSAALNSATPGCIEFDGNVVYAGTTGGRGVVDASHIAFATSVVSLSGVTTYQSIFTSTADVITLAANTTYIVEGHLVIESGTTTHTTAVRLTEGVAVNAPTFRLHFLTTGAAAATPTRAQDTTYFETSGGVLNATSPAARTFILLRGSIETIDSLTITPQVAFSANPGGTNQTAIGSWIKFTPIGTNTMTSVGPWA